MEPIGYLNCTLKWRIDAASQPYLSQSNNSGTIELLPENNFEQALSDLSDMSHVWILFWFHLNHDWHPKTQVPRISDRKISVFATRSPYRPNPIGMSLVELVEIKGRKLIIKGFDLLDGTPILDIKPFHPDADRPQTDFRGGWLTAGLDTRFEFQESHLFQQQCKYLQKVGVPELAAFCRQQLADNPMNSTSKRIRIITPDQGVISYRTWRVNFRINQNFVELMNVYSGYSREDLDSSSDLYRDKPIHRAFLKLWTVPPP